MCKTMRGTVTLFFLLPILCISCVSTKVYETRTAQVFQDDVLIVEEVNSLKNGKRKSYDSTIYRYVDFDDDEGDSIHAVIERKIKNKSEKTKISIYEDKELIETKVFKSKKGKIRKFKKHSENEQLMKCAYEIMNAEQIQDKGKWISKVTSEKVTVESTPNIKFLSYSIFGKPFVILGSTAWNLVKCAGYAFVNFFGGYTTVYDGKFFWVMPDIAGSKKKYQEQRVKNTIVYPQYHIPFTNNKIAVKKMNSEVSNIFKENNTVKVLSEEDFTYDNSLSVKKSASADAALTASVVGVAGSIITVPVSAVTWVGGALYGVWDKTR